MPPRPRVDSPITPTDPAGLTATPVDPCVQWGVVGIRGSAVAATSQGVLLIDADAAVGMLVEGPSPPENASRAVPLPLPSAHTPVMGLSPITPVPEPLYPSEPVPESVRPSNPVAPSWAMAWNAQSKRVGDPRSAHRSVGIRTELNRVADRASSSTSPAGSTIEAAIRSCSRLAIECSSQLGQWLIS